MSKSNLCSVLKFDFFTFHLLEVNNNSNKLEGSFKIFEERTYERFLSNKLPKLTVSLTIASTFTAQGYPSHFRLIPELEPKKMGEIYKSHDLA